MATGDVPIEARVITARVRRVRVHTDPEVDLFEVVFHSKADTGVWQETARTPEELATMLRGAKAGATMVGYRFELEDSQVPQEPSRHFVLKDV